MYTSWYPIPYRFLHIAYLAALRGSLIVSRGLLLTEALLSVGESAIATCSSAFKTGGGGGAGAGAGAGEGEGRVQLTASTIATCNASKTPPSTTIRRHPCDPKNVAAVTADISCTRGDGGGGLMQLPPFSTDGSLNLLGRRSELPAVGPTAGV
jgi:hypothetical protein